MARAMRNNERVLQLTLSILAFGAGVWLMVEGAEKFTEGVLRLSARLGVATFVLGYLLSGIDLENLAVGVASASQGQPGISLGTVIGSAVFLLTFAVGVTAVTQPLATRTPKRLLIMTLASPLPMLIASLDGVISRVDGVVLLSLSIALIAFVVHTARTHPLLQVKAQKLDKAARVRPGWWPAALLIGGSLAIVAGAELFSWSVKGVLEWLGWSGTRFGMLIVAAAVSAEEIPRMLSAARRGHSEVSVGNILGTVMFFTLFNLGIIALVQPLPMERSTMTFYWPAMYVALAIVVALLWRGKVSRLAGVTLLVAFAGYVAAAPRGSSVVAQARTQAFGLPTTTSAAQIRPPSLVSPRPPTRVTAA